MAISCPLTRVSVKGASTVEHSNFTSVLSISRSLKLIFVFLAGLRRFTVNAIFSFIEPERKSSSSLIYAIKYSNQRGTAKHEV